MQGTQGRDASRSSAAISRRAAEAWARHLGISTEAVDSVDLLRRLTAGTIPEVLARAGERHPASTVSVDDRRITLAGLHSEVTRVASVISDAVEIQRGDRAATVVICARSSVDLIVAYLGTLHAGFTAVLANPAYTANELARLVERSSSVLLITDGSLAWRASGSVPTLYAPELRERAAVTRPMPPAPRTSDDIALLAFTSGTTGDPKAVPLTHAHLLSSIRGAMWSWQWSADDTLVHALPLFHQHGLSGLHATLIAGSNLTVLSEFDPSELVATVSGAQGSVLFGVPAIHRRLLDLDPSSLLPLAQLRLITSGSGPLPTSLAQEFREVVGVPLLERYGLTESGLNVSNYYRGARFPGTVGSPLPGIEVALADGHGRLQGSLSEGEILVRGPQIFDGYLDDENATREAFWPGGWFRTGDLGQWTDTGALRITGRLKELVITGGMNVSPAEVERAIELLPGVREAAVAGRPSDRWGEEVNAWVVMSPGSRFDPGEIIEHCRRHLAPFKCPKHVFEISELPRNAMGKVVRQELARGGSA